MVFTSKTMEEKPYNMCLDCVHLGKQCDGPNFLAMSVERWCEWIKLRKEYLGWTNQQIADIAEISTVSVARAMSGNVKDIRISTMQAITKALVNGTWGQYPCAMASLAEPETVYVDNPEIVTQLNQANHEITRLRDAIDKLNIERKDAIDSARSEDQRKIDFLLKQIAFKEEQMKEKDLQIQSKDKRLEERRDYLKRKDKYILALAIALGVCLFAIIAALVIDSLNPNAGFFWIDNIMQYINPDNGLVNYINGSV